uniref:Phosphoribosylamine-glycine ligase n=1 Tax=Coccidioides posadasii RMSCC 3488 TaxID=454284 RepID=A0A0J6F5N6_COCPO|nr:phosphoribosylamine-glycine ligase [Coccidioides posadasii RMSCC 3488]
MPLDIQIFYARNNRSSDGELTTAEGRVFSVSTYGPSLEEAVSCAYRGVESIQSRHRFYRKNIASRYEDLLVLMIK